MIYQSCLKHTAGPEQPMSWVTPAAAPIILCTRTTRSVRVSELRQLNTRAAIRTAPGTWWNRGGCCPNPGSSPLSVDRTPSEGLALPGLPELVHRAGSLVTQKRPHAIRVEHGPVPPLELARDFAALLEGVEVRGLRLKPPHRRAGLGFGTPTTRLRMQRNPLDLSGPGSVAYWRELQANLRG